MAGTITGRKLQSHEHPSFGPPPGPAFERHRQPQCLAHPKGNPMYNAHSNSMTHLYQPYMPRTPKASRHQRLNRSSHDFRFNASSKVYKSEPDLRVDPTVLHTHAPSQTTLRRSPVKDRMKSRKPNRAPPPPSSSEAGFSDGFSSDSRPRSEHSRVRWGRFDASSAPSSQVSTVRRQKKQGLYKKNENMRYESQLDGPPRKGILGPRVPLNELGKSVDKTTGSYIPERFDQMGRNYERNSNTAEMKSNRLEEKSIHQAFNETLKKQTSSKEENKVKVISESKNTLKKEMTPCIDEINMRLRHSKRVTSPAATTGKLNKEKECVIGPNSKDSHKDLMVSNKTSNKSFDKEKALKQTDSPDKFYFGMVPNTPEAMLKNDSKDNDLPIVENTIVHSPDRLNSKYSYHRNSRREISNQTKMRQTEGNNSSRKYRPLDSSSSDDQPLEEFALKLARKNVSSEKHLLENSKRDDPGYHSRQSSGNLHSSNGNTSDEIEPSSLTVNLRPILPRRQNEIPRFNPNSAWKDLGEDPIETSKPVIENTRKFYPGEERIEIFSRPIAPRRSSTEKSADSGISGDAGSPGPIADFEPTGNLDSIKSKNTGGPIAVSTPVIFNNMRRAWTPAEDLEDNSMGDESHDYLPEVPVNDGLANSQMKSQSRGDLFDLFNLKKSDVSNKQPETDNTNCHNKLNRSISGSLESDRHTPHDVWRENWVMSSSIPSSLNKCNKNESPAFSASNCDLPSKLNGGELSTSSEIINAISRNTKSMYLPEYNPKYTSHVNTSAHSKVLENDGLKQKQISGVEPEISTAVDTNGNFSELYKKQKFMNRLSGDPRGKNGKKFAFKSTVRVLEMKKIEEKLNREIEENERKRLREAAAMKQVEQEFQIKREKEKKVQQRQGEVVRSQSSVHKSTQSEHVPRPKLKPTHQHSFAVKTSPAGTDHNGNLSAKSPGRERVVRGSTSDKATATTHPFVTPLPAQVLPLRPGPLTIPVNQ